MCGPHRQTRMGSNPPLSISADRSDLAWSTLISLALGWKDVLKDDQLAGMDLGRSGGIVDP